MTKDPIIDLEHILYSIELIEKYSKNVTKKDFLASTQLQDSIVRRIEVIGEAGKNLPPSIKVKSPKVQWKKIVGMRDVLAHGYLSVDLDLTWEVVKRDIPILKDEIIRLLERGMNDKQD